MSTVFVKGNTAFHKLTNRQIADCVHDIAFAYRDPRNHPQFRHFIFEAARRLAVLPDTRYVFTFKFETFFP